MTIHYFSDVDGVPMIRMNVSQYDDNIAAAHAQGKAKRCHADRVVAWQELYKRAMADVDAWHALAREHGAEGQRPEDLRDTLTARMSENHHRSEAMYNEAIAALAKWRKLAIEHGSRGATGDVIRGHLRTILVGERERKTADLAAWARLARSYDVEGDDAETLREGLRSRIGCIKSDLDESDNISGIRLGRIDALRRERDEARANQRDAEKSDSDMISRAVVQAKTLDVWQSLARGYGLQGEGADLVDSLREFVDFLRSGQTVKLADVLELVRGERGGPADHMTQTHTRLDRYRAENQDWRELANNFGCDYGSNPNMVANLKSIIHADRGNLSKYIEEVTDWRKLAYSYGCDGDPSTRENLRSFIDRLMERVDEPSTILPRLFDHYKSTDGVPMVRMREVDHRDQCAELRASSWRELGSSHGRTGKDDMETRENVRKYIDRLIGRVSELERRAARFASGESPLDDRMASVDAQQFAAHCVWRDLAKSYGCAGDNDAATRENLSGYIEGLVKRVKELLGKLRQQCEAEWSDLSEYTHAFPTISGYYIAWDSEQLRWRMVEMVGDVGNIQVGQMRMVRGCRVMRTEPGSQYTAWSTRRVTVPDDITDAEVE